MAAYFSPDFLVFFSDLEQNNERNWFETNKKRYEREVKAPLARLVSDLQDTIAGLDPNFKQQTPNQLIFRIYRDIRFSKDKTPYKTHAGAFFCQRGKKPEWPGFYLQFSHSGAMACCGLYEVGTNALRRIRDKIAAEPAGFQSLVDAPAFKQAYGELLGDRGKVLPASLKAAAAQEPRLYNKQFYFAHERPAEWVLSETLLPELVELYNVAMPYHVWLASAIEV